MNNVKFVDKVGRVQIVKLTKANPLEFANQQHMVNPTLAMAHRFWLAKGYVRQNRKAA
jgi:hypothetical protein